MKPIDFSSSLCDELKHFVELKQLSGSDYHSSAMFLLRFDRHLINRSFKGKALTKAILQNYLDDFGHLSIRGFSNQYGVLRLFSIWLNQRVQGSYVLEQRCEPKHSHSPSAYIFNLVEIAKILYCSGHFSPREEFAPRLYQTVFGLLYSTGIRIGEALALNRDDYSRSDKLLHIQNGKFRKERYLILSDSTAESLNRYIDQTENIMTVKKDSPLFLNTRGKRLTYHSVTLAFVKALKRSGIAKGDGVRLHCFRHTFAIHRLLQWYQAKRDVNALLPILSTYMGHVDITSTQIYLQSSNELLRLGGERFRSFFIQ
ncbi:MAG: tyrosine-type recombinase/integrase, partial [bacterium]|nr:tyrosine-type recombinase/integrase [bacterium]